MESDDPNHQDNSSPREPSSGRAEGGSREAQLIEAQAALLNQAAAALEAASSWSLGAPMVLVDEQRGEARVLPIGQIGLWLDHLPPELDGFVRLRQGGRGLEEAYNLSRAEGGAYFDGAWERAQEGVALVCHDDLARFAALAQRGFARSPRELLVVVRWPENVSAFLLSCQRQSPNP